MAAMLLLEGCCLFFVLIVNLIFAQMTHNLLFALGPTEIIIILLIVLLLFGGRKIPELMRGLGKGMKEFKNAQKEDDQDDRPSETKPAGEKKE